MDSVYYGSYNPKYGCEETYNKFEKANRKIRENSTHWSKPSPYEDEEIPKPKSKENPPKISRRKDDSNFSHLGVNKSSWGVRIVSTNADYGHAALFIEGCDENNDPFVIKAHLTDGSGREVGKKQIAESTIGHVRVIVCSKSSGIDDNTKIVESPTDLLKRYPHSSKRWLVSASKVSRMLDKIFKECTHINEQEKVSDEKVFMNLFAHTHFSDYVDGVKLEDSFLKKVLKNPENLPHQMYLEEREGGVYSKYAPDNCISWVGRKLRMLDIEIPIKVGTYIPNFPKKDVKTYGDECKKEEDSVKGRKPYNKKKEDFIDLPEALDKSFTDEAKATNQFKYIRQTAYNSQVRREIYIPQQPKKSCCQQICFIL